jgi:(2Fe-2S) ferredoxin
MAEKKEEIQVPPPSTPSTPPTREEELPPSEIELSPEVRSALQAVDVIDYLTKKLKEGELSVPEALLLMDYLEKRRASSTSREGERGERLSWPELIMIDSWLERKQRGQQASTLTEEQVRRIVKEVFDESREPLTPEKVKEIIKDVLSEGKKSETTLTAEDVKKIVREMLSEIKPKTEEIPAWAKNMQDELQTIKERFKQQEQAERDRKLIEEHQKPILEKLRDIENRYVQLEKNLEELRNRPSISSEEKASINTAIKEIKETLADIREAAKLMGLKEPEEVKPPPSPTPPSVGGELKKVKELLTDIKETGKLLGLKEPEELPKSNMLEGLPVKGEVPVWLVAIPKIIDNIFENIEKRASLWLTPQQQPLLQMPQRPTMPPQPPPEQPPVRIEQPLIRLPPKPQPPPLTQPQPSIPMQPPTQPIQPQKPPEKPPEAPKAEIIEIKPVEMKPSEEKAKEEKPEVKPPPEKPPEKPAVMPSEEKKYKCKICGEAFSKWQQLGGHMKKHRKKEAKEAKPEISRGDSAVTPTEKREGEGRQEQLKRKESTTPTKS